MDELSGSAAGAERATARSYAAARLSREAVHWTRDGRRRDPALAGSAVRSVALGANRRWSGALDGDDGLVDFDPAVSAELQRALTDLYAAFNVRDVETLLRAMAPDVVWPNGWEGGVVRGHEEVRDYWTRQWAEIDPAVEPVGFGHEQDGRVSVTVRQVVRDLAGTVIAEGRVTHVYRFADGLVRDMEIRS